MIEKSRCTGCGACAAVCPVSAIQMVEDAEGFLYPVMDTDCCIGCDACSRVCPPEQGAIEPEREAEAFLAYTCDPLLRKQSSSGGAFSMLAGKILEQGGAVFGCAMDADCRGASHIRVDSVEKMALLRGSKYVQSRMGDVLRQVQKDLHEGRWVLFSGTPCQVAGLRAFLKNKEQDKLLTADLICHGAPSPMVWREYVRQLEKESGSKLIRVQFRDKARGWRLFSLTCEFQNGTVRSKTVAEDLFLRSFVQDLYLRPSCHQCAFKGENYRSDLTLGDFWGVERVLPEETGDAGISLIIAHTAKGIAALENLEGTVQPVPLKPSLESNRPYYHSVKPNPFRNAALRQIRLRGTKGVLAKYCGTGLSAKCRRKLAAILKK